MAQKEDIRPIYNELQGYLSQAPKKDRGYYLYDVNLWEQVNQAIHELEKASGEDYSRFRMTPRLDEQGIRRMLDKDTYRTKLSGLVRRLYGQYFPDERAPFSGMPSTVISQTQQQSQSFQMQMVLEIQSKIDEKLLKSEPDGKTKSFLEKVKGALASVRNTAELIALILTTGQEFGLTFEELKELFK